MSATLSELLTGVFFLAAVVAGLWIVSTILKSLSDHDPTRSWHAGGYRDIGEIAAKLNLTVTPTINPTGIFLNGLLQNRPIQIKIRKIWHRKSEIREEMSITVMLALDKRVSIEIVERNPIQLLLSHHRLLRSEVVSLCC